MLPLELNAREHEPLPRSPEFSYTDGRPSFSRRTACIHHDGIMEINFDGILPFAVEAGMLLPVCAGLRSVAKTRGFFRTEHDIAPLRNRGLSRVGDHRGDPFVVPVVPYPETFMSLQGKSEEEIRALETALLAKVQELGGSAGNTTLQRSLNWKEEDYWPIRDRLVDLGSLRRYRARGGAVALVPPPQQLQIEPESQEQPAEQQPAPVNASAEKYLYEPVATVLNGQWARDSRFRHHIVEITASQGRRNTGGTWTRPDIVVAALRVFPFLPGKFFDLITFEIKPTGALDVTAVYEALAHRRAATQSYVWLHCKSSAQETEVLSRIKEEAERHGIGVITATDPADYDTWETIAEPARVEPDPEALNEFIALQVTDGAKEELAAWVR